MKNNVSLTIGNFDGVHLGHQAILNRLKELSPHPALFTFSNHPDEVLHSTRVPLLTSINHRLSLLKSFGVDQVISVPFTHEFSRQTAREFLASLHSKLSFSHLVLGHDAVIGCDRNRNLQEICLELGCQLEYLEPIQVAGKIVSSSVIRSCIQQGQLDEASRLLGRPYSILGQVQRGAGKGKMLGFLTANIPVHELALPPLGVYAVEVRIGQMLFPAVANLGRAPTLHQDRPPFLEVHLIDEERDLYGQNLEIVFCNFLRPEKKFASLNELQVQIRHDVEMAKNSLIISSHSAF